MWILEEMKMRQKSEQTAVICREKVISFQELWNKSEKIADYILQHNRTKEPVLIYGNKENDILIVILACLKSGRAYVPVDITFPLDRLYKIIEKTSCEMIFNFTERNIVCEKETNIISKNRLIEIESEQREVEVREDNWVKEDDICYILFTSGSTGEPKGVQIKRKNIENFTSWFQTYCMEDSTKHLCVLNQVSYSFDVSVISLYIYLPLGNTLISIDKDMMENHKELLFYLKKSQIAVWISTPAFLDICSFYEEFNVNSITELGKFILAGEVLTKNLVSRIKTKFPKAKVINGYGPTEGTVLLSACEITNEMMKDKKNLPIGFILPEAEYRIERTEAYKELFEKECGELVVISNSISQGYYKNEKETEKSFFNSNGKRGYYTGDLVYEDDGIMYYVGRKDTQIKLNGFRIELNDIIYNLNKIDVVNSSVVCPIYMEGKISYLTAFVILEHQLQSSAGKMNLYIRKQLKELIPSYMIPKKIVYVEQFPMNVNGKVDRKRLVEEYL